MKRMALCLAGISSILLFSATLLRAAEQKTVFNTESIKHRSGTNAEMCRDKCGRRSGPEVKSLLAEGWKILSSNPKEVIAEEYWYIPCNTCDPHGCTCIGTEYNLWKDNPVPKVETSNNEVAVPKKTWANTPKAETSNNEFVAPDNNRKTGANAPKLETSDSERDLLKKENDLLKQEIGILKQEIENLKKQRK